MRVRATCILLRASGDGALFSSIQGGAARARRCAAASGVVHSTKILSPARCFLIIIKKHTGGGARDGFRFFFTFTCRVSCRRVVVS